jgi:CRP/FNR family transcriptional regulator, cyclic AMP receptor protein
MLGVPEAAIEELAGSARGVVYAGGETVFGGGSQLVPGLVVDGAIRLIVRSADGREATLRTVGRGGMFGLIGLFDAQRSVVTVERSLVAGPRTTVHLFEPATLMRVALRHAGLAMHLARHLAESANVLTDTAGQFAFMTVRQRLSAHLLGIAAHEPDGRLAAGATQQQLANAIGSVREVVARTLHDLREEGLIEVSRGRVTILEPGALAANATM